MNVENQNAIRIYVIMHRVFLHIQTIWCLDETNISLRNTILTREVSIIYYLCQPVRIFRRRNMFFSDLLYASRKYKDYVYGRC